jgi:hypothetical protein
MTGERRAAIKRLIDHQTKIITSSSEVARRTLIAEGIYNDDGNLAAEYGGEEEQKGTPKRAVR